MNRWLMVGCAAVVLAVVVLVAGIVSATSPSVATPARSAPGAAWTPLGHGVYKRCDGHAAIYVYDATSSKGGIAVTSWSAECP